MSEILDALAPLAKAAGSGAMNILDAAAASATFTAEAHPLGMVAIRFPLRSFVVRVHVWATATQAFRDEFGQIHDHTWDLDSHVLLGEIENARYDLCEHPSGEPVWLHDYSTHSVVDSGRRMMPVLLRREVYRGGNSYELAAGQMHSTVRTAEGTMTLVKAVPTSLRVARILGATAAARQRSAVRRTVTPHEALQYVRMAVQIHG